MEKRCGWNNQWSVPRPKDRTDRLTKILGWFSLGLGIAEVAVPGTVSRIIGLKESAAAQRSVLRLFGFREIAAGIGILTRPRSAGWLWSRVVGDLMDLAALGASVSSKESDRTKAAIAVTAVLGVTALDVYCGRRLSRDVRYGVPIPDILMY